jgi:DNA-binding beta-propeller fold protein YncE
MLVAIQTIKSIPTVINQTDGSLTAIGFVSSNQCRTVVVDPSGKYAYSTEDVGGVSGKINKFSIQPTGSLISNGSIALGRTIQED